MKQPLLKENHKLGIIVPYRNRPEQLETFLLHMTEYLKDVDFRYEIFVINQDNAKQFNRGMLLNIGYTYAVKSVCDYIVFHDVDMLPVDVDYSYSNIPLHLSIDFLNEDDEKERDVFEEYFGGVTLFPIETFKQINGYSNKYWAWGYEDTDLLFRCKQKNINLNTLKIKNLGRKGKFLKFNGVDSYVKCKNIIDLNNNATIFVSFYPDKLNLNYEKESDEFTVFSIPGWDFAIAYTSFSRYNFCAFDINHNALYINSKIKTNYKTNITITFNREENKLKVYQDGEFIGETPYFKRLYFYRKEKFFYLGVGKPDRELIPNYYIGHIDSFAYFDSILELDEIEEISNNDIYLIRKNFGNYRSSSNLKCYYDAGHIKKYTLTDLSGNENHAEIFNCEVVDLDFEDYTEIKIPHRRKSLFKSLKHEENGFLGNKWKDRATRWNQLRFHNEIVNEPSIIDNDGLNTLEFIEHGKFKHKKITEINVGI
jgi:hypothetical protein